MINGVEYAWEDIQIVIEGKLQPIRGIKAIEYTRKRNHTNIYGAGSKPVAVGRGQVEDSGSITLLQSEVEAMQRSWGGDITRKVFGVTVAYAPEGGQEVTDQLLLCRITELKKGMKQGDGNMEVELPLIIGDIKYGI
jgi:hypothetical protein